MYDDVVLLVAMKAEDTAANGKKRTRKRKVRPGAVLLKYFRDIASADLNALFPDVRVVMNLRDQLMLGVPALIGGIPILLKLASTVTVLFLVAGFYLGFSSVGAGRRHGGRARGGRRACRAWRIRCQPVGAASSGSR